MAQQPNPRLEQRLLEEAYSEPHPVVWIAASTAAATLCAGESLFFTLTGNFPATVATVALSAAAAGMGVYRHRRYKRIIRYFGDYPHL